VSAAAAFLFDLDGTLADTLPDLAASTNHVRTLHDLPPVPDATVRGFLGDGAQALLRRALAERSLDEAALERAFERYAEHHAQHCHDRPRLFPRVAEHLGALRDRGHPIAIVTNKPERFAAPVVRSLGLHEFTSVVVGGDTLKTRKPDPAMLAHALRLLGAEASGATMVGDGLQDLRAGKALDLRTIACLYGYGDPGALIAAGPDALWSQFGGTL